MSDAVKSFVLPAFQLPATNNRNISHHDCKNHNVILYFYPKDNTPGCTTETIAFRDHYAQFKKLNTLVFGISRDSVKSHDNFHCKYELPFDLISDDEELLCEYFDVIKEKNMYGKKVRGIERSTFLFDKNSQLVSEWRKVKVDGHVEEVLEAVKKLQGKK